MAARAWRAAGAWLLAAALVPAPTAVAQGLSPEVDRDSPAGVEYQLPVESARRQVAGDGGGAPSPGASGRAPLFGEGVKRASRAAPGDGRPATGSARRRAQRPALTADAPPVVRSQAPAPDGAGGGLLAVGAAGAGVLLAGGLAGLGWRRRVRPA